MVNKKTCHERPKIKLEDLKSSYTLCGAGEGDTEGEGRGIRG